ncbi:O-antigen ligase [Meiothermus sp.]|uniref:O-antigen ligase family protein n=1 Tax=Meiothermus sp. TaxID=1955249 RepID=UPI0026330A27|nr:O-antigen ligase family protein [Meiothermus sp.]
MQPAWFAVIMGLLGVFALVFRKERMWFVLPFGILALLGAGSQLMGPNDIDLETPSLPSSTYERHQTINLIPPYGLYDLRGWNHQDGSGPPGIRQSDGFRRVTRVHLPTGRHFTEILSNQIYPLKEGETYTQSFYFRHDGDEISFDFLFTTAKGQFGVPAKIETFPNGLKRAYASYKAQPGDKTLRAIDIYNLHGNWSYIDIGYAQLEIGLTPSRYTISLSKTKQSHWQRAVWWLGTGLLGFLVLVGSYFSLKHSGDFLMALGIVVGLLINLGAGLAQVNPAVEQRISGLTENPNLYGVGAVISVMLASLASSRILGLLALIFGLGIVALSDSRAAWLGLLGAIPLWFSRLSSRWGYVFLILSGVFVALALYLWLPSRLDRLATVTDLNYVNNQSRLEIWAVAWQAFLDHPLTGIGIGKFQIYYLKHLPIDALEPAATHAHNLFLHLLAEAGLLSLTGFLGLLGVIIRILWQKRQWAVLIVIGTALIMNLFDYTWFYAGVYYPLWVAIAWGLRPTPDTMRG